MNPQNKQVSAPAPRRYSVPAPLMAPVALLLLPTR